MSRKEVILTAEGLKLLQEEVNYLSTAKREEVEHRISVLTEKLLRARVIKDSEIETEKVSVGNTVTLRDINGGEIRVYYLVGSAEADPTQAKLSNESPVGQAIIGKRVGDQVTVPVPVGSLSYEIVSIGKNR